MRLRVPSWLQLAAVVGLLAASLTTLWEAGESLVRRDRRRAVEIGRLVEAEEALAAAGAGPLVLVPDWPASLGAAEWRALGGLLAESRRQALAEFSGVEGGFFVPAGERFLGGPGAEGGPDEDDRVLVKVEALQALDSDGARQIVVESSPRAVALRTAPVWVNGRQVAATWTLVRLDDRGAVASTIRGYRTAAGLAFGGVTLSLGLALGMALRLRRQARERERLQADLRRNERLAALGTLLAGVAHEVRNPLAGIRSTGQLWQRGLPPDGESICDLLAEVDRVEAIVSRLLQFSRAEARDRRPGDLNTAAVEAARLARTAAEGQGVAVALDLAPGPLVAEFDPEAVLQVLRNLTTNALQAMPGGGELRIATRREGGLVSLVVADRGQGLACEVARHLFEPFFTTKPDGTGLGLAIAREIALSHGGDLDAQNRRDGPGAAFRLTLPEAKPLKHREMADLATLPA